MRKSIKKLFTILFVLLLTCQLFAVDGVVTYVKGKVEVKKGSSWVTLKVGDKVSQSSMINTGFQSEAKVKLMNNILYLGPVTRVTLSTLASSEDRDKVNVFLSTGSVRSKVNRTDTKRVSYTVRTPIAVASVRGTLFSLDINNNCDCSDGTVALKSNLNLQRKPSKKSSNNNSDEGDSSKNSISTLEEGVDSFTEEEGLPKDGIYVSKNQSAKISNSMLNPETQHNAARNTTKVIGIVSSEGSKQAAKTEGSSVAENAAEAVVTEEKAPAKGSVSVNIKLPAGTI